MNTIPLMQQALGEQWAQLPPALQAHYQHGNNTDVGALDIEYPAPMQPYLSFLRLLGALVNRRGKAVPTTVEKWMEGGTQRWKRTLSFADGIKPVAGDMFEIEAPAFGLPLKNPLAFAAAEPDAVAVTAL